MKAAVWHPLFEWTDRTRIGLASDCAAIMGKAVHTIARYSTGNPADRIPERPIPASKYQSEAELAATDRYEVDSAAPAAPKSQAIESGVTAFLYVGPPCRRLERPNQ